MSVSADFINAVNSGELRLVRIMLKDSMVVDPTFKEFDELLQYAQLKLANLYDKHDGEVFNNDTRSWNKEYMDKEMIQIVYNFSKERVEFLKKVTHHVYIDRVKKKEDERSKIDNKQKEEKKRMGKNLAIGGTAATVVGIITSHTVITVLGIAAAVGGGIIYFNSDK